MNLKQAIVVISALVLLLFVFLMPIDIDHTDENGTNDQVLEDDFSFEVFQAERLEKLEDEAVEKIAALQTVIADQEYPENKEYYDSLVTVYLDYGELALAADIAKQKAEKTGKESDWLAAGEFFRIELINQQHRHPYYFFLVRNFRNTLEKALEINPENLDTQVDLAGLLMEDDTKVMEGVNILLKVVEEEPKHHEANLLLGRFGIVSGQYDRAIERLENAIMSRPENAEAYFFLGEAYYGAGKVAKAVEMFELCKSLVDDPEFERELDNYIERISKN